MKFGKLKSCRLRGQIAALEFENGEGKIELISPWIVNVFCGFETSNHHSYSIEEHRMWNTEIRAREFDGGVELCTDHLRVQVCDGFKVDVYSADGRLLCADYRGERSYEPTVNHADLILAAQEGHEVSLVDKNHKIEILKAMQGDECFYGFGDKTGSLNKRGCEYEMWNTNNPAPQMENVKSLYKSVPFFITLREDCVFGLFFDNHYKTYFDMGKENASYYYIGADDGNLDYYMFFGENMSQVLEGYCSLTGTHELPPLWALGYHQSRWSYESESRMRETAARLRMLGIPCDALYLDIDFMERFKVFTWDREKFPQPEKMIADLKKQGFKTVAILDPAVKKEEGYPVYEEGAENGYFLKDKNGEIYYNKVWAGVSAYPDFSKKSVRDWWGDREGEMLDQGLEGILMDMNEPSTFDGLMPLDVVFDNDGSPTSHKEMHNLYGNLMGKAVREGWSRASTKRPFIVTRACFAGMQKYSMSWTGDNHSIWVMLRESVAQICSMGLSGMGFTGADVGGYGSDCSGELLARWTQLGAFYPYFRNHSSRPTRFQEPWRFGEEVLDVCRKYIRLRYRLLPYLYDLFWQMERTGLPVMRPLVLEYERDPRVREISDQFMIGPSLMAAPALAKGMEYRAVYLPEGRWMDYWKETWEKGGEYVLRETSLDCCPLYVRENSIIPMYPVQNYVGETEIRELTLLITGREASYIHFQDNGEDMAYRKGEYNEYLFEYRDRVFQVSLRHGGYERVYDSYRLLVNGKEYKISRRLAEAGFACMP